MSPPSESLDTQLANMDPRYGPLLDRVVEALARLEEVAVIAVSGSAADGIADKYSDLDLQCGVRTVDATAARSVSEAVFSQMTVGDYRWTAPNRILSVVDVSWLRLDVTILVAEMEPFAHNAIVAHNPDGVEVRRAPPPSLVPDPEGLAKQISRFLRSLGLVVRDLHRGDLRLCCFAVEFLVDDLITLMYQAQGLVRGAQKGAYSQLPSEDVEVLQSLPVAQPERHSIIQGHVAVADEYLARARLLADEWGATWPTEMEQGTRAFLRRELDVELAAV